MTVDPGAVDAPTRITITWTFTDTYRHQLNLAMVADAAGHSVAAVATDPSLLHGRAGDRLADLLTAFQDPTRTVDVPEVEIVTTDLEDQPSLADLVEQARRIAAAEAHTGCPTRAGQALAALLAGLHREQLVD